MEFFSFSFPFNTIIIYIMIINKDPFSLYNCRYMLAAIVIGFAYSLLQLAFSTCHLISGNRFISGDGGILVDFYSEKVHIIINILSLL
jgi:hypothetical protein